MLLRVYSITFKNWPSPICPGCPGARLHVLAFSSMMKFSYLHNACFTSISLDFLRLSGQNLKVKSGTRLQDMLVQQMTHFFRRVIHIVK